MEILNRKRLSFRDVDLDILGWAPPIGAQAELPYSHFGRKM
jgi:hypothetical protein